MVNKTIPTMKRISLCFNKTLDSNTSDYLTRYTKMSPAFVVKTFEYN